DAFGLITVIMALSFRRASRPTPHPSGHHGSGFAGLSVSPPRGGGGRQAASGVVHFSTRYSGAANTIVNAAKIRLLSAPVVPLGMLSSAARIVARLASEIWPAASTVFS